MRKFERSESIPTLNEDLAPLSLEQVEGLPGVVLVNRDFSTALAWRLNAPNFELASDAQQEAMHTTLRSLLNQLPAHYDIQIRWSQSSRSAEFAEKVAARATPPGLAGECVSTSASMLVEGLQTGALAWKSCTVVLVRGRRSDEFVDSSSRGGAGKALGKIARVVRMIMPRLSSAKEDLMWQEESWAAVCRELVEQSSLVTGLLSSVDPQVAALDYAGWMRLFFSWLNKTAWDEGRLPPTYRPDQDIPLSEYFCLSDWKWNPPGASPRVAYLDSAYHGLLTMHLPPDDLEFPFWERVVRPSLHCEVIVNASPIAVGQRLRRLTRKRKQVHGKGNDPTTIAMRAAIDAELAELGGGDEKLYRATFFVHVWGPTPEGVDDACSQIVAAAHASAGGGVPAELIRESYGLWPYFRATCPGYTSDRDRYRTTELVARKLAHLLPVHGQPMGLSGKRLGALFPTQNGSILNVDFHDLARFKVPHFVIAAGSGQGKSVLASSLLLELLGPDGRAVIVDRGGSFRGLAAAFNAPFINFRDRSTTINPLDFDTTQAVLEPDAVESAVGLLEAMIMFSRDSLSKTPGMPGDERTALYSTVRAQMERHLDAVRQGLLSPMPTIRTIVDALSSQPKFEQLAVHLNTWSASGAYGRLFDGPTNLPPNRGIAVIDLGDTTDSSDYALTAVSGMVVLAQAARILSSYRCDRKFLIFDELAKAMENETLRRYIEFAYRTNRKLGIACGALSQKVVDASHLLGHCSHFFFLRQDDARDLNHIQAALGFPPSLIDHVGALETRPGEYAEFVLLTKDDKESQIATALNVSHPIKYALITTSSGDVSRIKGLMRDEKLTTEAALRRFAQEYPRGVLHSGK